MKKVVNFIIFLVMIITLNTLSINIAFAEEVENQDKTITQETEIIDGTTITSEPFEEDKSN